jgi:hypothetical protein
VSVLRPNVNQPLEVSADCLAGEQVTGGGARAEASELGDMERMHLQESGPTSSGWFARAAPTSRFSPGSVFTLTVTVYCLGTP